MVYFKVEKLSNCLNEMKYLFENHWEEVALNKDKIKLNPDYDKYLAIEELGMISVVVAREESTDRLIGYSVDFINPHLHYKDHLFAINDIIFLHPDFRLAGVAFRLLKKVQDHLKSLDVAVHMLHMKTEHLFRELAKASGYNFAEETWSMYLGE